MTFSRHRVPSLITAVIALGLTACALVPATGVQPGGGSRISSSNRGGAGSGGTSSASPSPSDLQGYTGVVLDLAGKPAANVTVTGYSLISNNGGSLISDKGSSLISNNGSSLAANGGAGLTGSAGLIGQMAMGAFHVLADPTSTVTDAQGRFTLKSPDGNAFNIEAVQGTSVKAFAAAVPTTTSGLEMQLAHTGVLSGEVTASGTAATDLIGVSVFVPGTEYVAMTDHNGAFSFANMPAGTFTLYATKTGLGSAQATGIVVKSDQTTTAPPLQLVQTVPTITGVSPAAGGPGTTVTITGTNFGATKGVPFSVTFGGAQADKPTRVNDTTIQAIVPGGAGSGSIVVTADQVPSKPFAFAVPHTITLQALLPDLVVGRTATFEAVVTDANGQVIPNLPLTWSTSSSAASVDASGKLTADSAGSVMLSASSGSVVGTLSLTISATPYVASLVGGGQAPNSGTYAEGQGNKAVFDQPDSVVKLPNGNWLISDSGNNCLRQVTPEGATSLFAGTPGAGGYAEGASGTAQFDDPSGLAVLPDGSVIVSDTFNHCLRHVAADGTVSLFAGTPGKSGYADGPVAGARFNRPTGLTVDSAGAVYVADAQNHLIRKVANGAVSTFAGTPPAVGAQPVGGFADGPAASAQFNDPLAVLMGPNGTLYVADAGNGRIRTVSGGTVATLAGSPATGAGSYNGWGYADGSGLQAHFAVPSHLALDAAGNLYVADEYNFLIRKITSDGTVSTLAGKPNPSLCCLDNGQSVDGPAGQAQLDQPAGLCFDADGNLDFLDAGTLRAIALPPGI